MIGLKLHDMPLRVVEQVESDPGPCKKQPGEHRVTVAFQCVLQLSDGGCLVAFRRALSGAGSGVCGCIDNGAASNRPEAVLGLDAKTVGRALPDAGWHSLPCAFNQPRVRPSTVSASSGVKLSGRCTSLVPRTVYSSPKRRFFDLSALATGFLRESA